MTRIIAIIALALLTLLPAPRCHVERSNGRHWLVCPCRGVTYQCADYYRIPAYRGR